MVIRDRLAADCAQVGVDIAGFATMSVLTSLDDAIIPKT